MRKGEPCPPLVRNLLLAERFHKTPLEIEEDDADSWLTCIQVMGLQGDVNEATEGLPHDEPVIRDGDV